MIGEVPQHLLSGSQLTPEVFNRISETSRRLQDPGELEAARKEIKIFYPLGAAGIALFVGEASLRTRYSFIRAGYRLDIPIANEPHPEQTLSLAKGETMPDTFMTLDALDYDFIIYRSKIRGAPEEAAANVDSSIIFNGGDGSGQHPSQAVLDMETIKRAYGTLDGLTLAHVGDPGNSRTVHSNIDALSYYPNTRHIFSSIPELGLDDAYRNSLKKRGIQFEEIQDIREVAKIADIIYLTRFQEERQFREGESAEARKARIDSIRQSYLKIIEPLWSAGGLRIVEESGTRLMHPGPTNDEWPYEFKRHPSGLFIDAMKEGLRTRTGIMYLAATRQLFKEYVEFDPTHEQAG